MSKEVRAIKDSVWDGKGYHDVGLVGLQFSLLLHGWFLWFVGYNYDEVLCIKNIRGPNPTKRVQLFSIIPATV